MWCARSDKEMATVILKTKLKQKKKTKKETKKKNVVFVNLPHLNLPNHIHIHNEQNQTLLLCIKAKNILKKTFSNLFRI